ncbi:hypothetical protein ACFC6L_18990 [Kitasatospora phosalacinea]|uniref:hypothetical protein n=1 Tax=Kitasatospora phosalacinea TaxID=2065 RepID=UPI0035DC662A
MSRSEVPEVDEAEDRPAIGAARLEAMFDGLRREVASGVPAPDGAEVVRRGVRRRQRRRVGAVAGVGVLGAAALWTVASVVPLQSRHGVAGVPVEQSAVPRPKPSMTWAFSPAPSLLVGPTASAPGAAPAWVLLPLDSAGPEVRALVLGVRRMPSVLGGYGPWKAVTSPPSASQPQTQSPLQSTLPSTSPSAPASVSASASGVSPAPSPGEEFADGCVSGLVARMGAVRAWGEAYTDGSDGEDAEEATAHQYVLDFGTPGAAKAAGARLLAGGGCVAPGAGWTLEDQGIGAVALGARQPGVSAEAEEVAVHVSGSVVAVLTVRRTGGGLLPEAGLSGPFLVAAAEFLALGVPTASGSPAGSAVGSPVGSPTG